MKFSPQYIQLNNGPTVEIREATVRDAEELIAAAKCYLRTSDYLLSYEEEFNPTKKEETEWIKSHDNANSLILVAIYDKKIIATLNVIAFTYRKLNHVATLGIGMLPEWRGVGLGYAMMDSIIQWAKTKTGLKAITLEVFSENKAAIGLYEKCGFVKDGEKENYFMDKNGNYYNNTLMTLYLK